MSRRSVPRIAPEDLRDHADDARVARVWDRIEHDLAGVEAPRARRSGLAYLAVAASFAAFGGGLFVGKLAFEDRGLVPVASATASDASTDDVLAAGTQGRSFTLPGGGRLTLAPGSTVELDRGAGGALMLKLVQGEASVDSAARASALAIVAGEARLDTQAGSVVSVRRAEDALDVSVRDGLVNLTSPVGARSLARGERVSAVPIRSVVAVAPPLDSATANTPPARRWNGPISVKAAKNGEPEWVARYEASLDDDEAFALLKKQSGGIEDAIRAARSARELMAIRDIALRRRDSQSAIAAATRVVDNFPDDKQRASVAAFDLGRMYAKAGQADRAEKFFRLARGLKPADSLADLAEDAFCGQIRASLAAGHKEEAARAASEYVAQYPNGRCKEEAEHAQQGAGDEGPAAPGTAPTAAPSAAPNADGEARGDKPAAPAPAPSATIAP